jgi:predicted dehydrogenase
VPFNAPPDQKAKVTLFTASGSEEFFFEAVDQYTIQGDLFAQAIIHDTPVPYSLDDAVNNMKVIEAVFESAKDKSWKDIIA